MTFDDYISLSKTDIDLCVDILFKNLLKEGIKVDKKTLKTNIKTFIEGLK